jgi:hypothetical protein
VPRAVAEGEPGERPVGDGAQDAAVPQCALGSKQRRGKRLAGAVGGRPGGSMTAAPMFEFSGREDVEHLLAEKMMGKV